jgi:CRISPR-associated exonuclease Cas4
MADVVEFHRVSETVSGFENGQYPFGARLDGVDGLWRPFPVEYKRGKLREEKEYEVQLCAQAICLEEMLSADVPRGALFYGETNRRLEISFTHDLRKETEAAALRLHQIARLGKTPRARYSKKCDKCSLISDCLPRAVGARRDVRRYLDEAIRIME